MDVAKVNELLGEAVEELAEQQSPPLQKKDPRVMEASRRLEAARDRLFLGTNRRMEFTRLFGKKFVDDIDKANKLVGDLGRKLRDAYFKGEYRP